MASTTKLDKRLDRLSSAFVAYVGLLIRRDYTTTYRGADVSLDNHIRLVAVKRIFSIDLRKREAIEINDDLLGQIESKISPETEKLIAGEVDRFLLFKVAILQTQLGQPLTYKPTRLQILCKHLEIGRRSARVHKFFAEANAFRAEVTYASLAKAFALISPALLLGGLLRQALLANVFGFDLGLVFTIGDYVSSSLSTLIFSLIPLAGMTVLVYFGFHEESRLDYKQRTKGSRAQTVQRRISFALVFAATVISYFLKEQAFYVLLPFSIMILAGVLFPCLARRYFKNGLAVFVVSFFMVSFFGFVAAGTMFDVESIRNASDHRTYLLQATDLGVDAQNLNLVTSGTYYKVFWDRTKKQTVLIKSDLVLAVVANPQKP